MFLKNKTILILLLLSITTLILFPAHVSYAADPDPCKNADDSIVEGPVWLQGLFDNGLIIPCNCIRTRCEKGVCEGDQCSIGDISQMIANIVQIILGVVGSLALLMLIWGGINMVISQGNEQKIEEAKNILKNAAIGILIVFGAWIIVNFVIIALGGEATGGLDAIQKWINK